MTRDDVIKMAREAGFRAGNITMSDGQGMPFVAPISATSCIVELERFAQLVTAQAAAEEREACARMADEYATWGGSNFYDWFKKLSAAIRARGTA